MNALELRRSCDLVLPLCRRYFVAVFDAVAIRTAEANSVSDQSAIWAQAWLDDGDSELLGVWLAPTPSIAVWCSVADDLRQRGLEQLTFEVNNVLGAAGPNLMFETRMAGPLQAGLLLKPLASTPLDLANLKPISALSRRRHRLVLSAVDMARLLNCRVFRTVRRRGSFVDDDTALSCIGQVLERGRRSFVHKHSCLEATFVAAAPGD